MLRGNEDYMGEMLSLLREQVVEKKLLHDDGRTIYAAAGIYNQKLRQNNLCAKGHEERFDYS